VQTNSRHTDTVESLIPSDELLIDTVSDQLLDFITAHVLKLTCCPGVGCATLILDLSKDLSLALTNCNVTTSRPVVIATGSASKVRVAVTEGNHASCLITQVDTLGSRVEALPLSLPEHLLHTSSCSFIECSCCPATPGTIPAPVINFLINAIAEV